MFNKDQSIPVESNGTSILIRAGLQFGETVYICEVNGAMNVKSIMRR